MRRAHTKFFDMGISHVFGSEDPAGPGPLTRPPYFVPQRESSLHLYNYWRRRW